MANILKGEVVFKHIKKNHYDIGELSPALLGKIDDILGGMVDSSIYDFSFTVNEVLFDKILSRMVADAFVTHCDVLDKESSVRISMIVKSRAIIVTVAKVASGMDGIIYGIIE